MSLVGAAALWSAPAWWQAQPVGLAGDEWAWRLLGDLPWTEGAFAVIAWAGTLLLGPIWGHLLGWLSGVVLGAVSLSWAASRLGPPMSPALLLMAVCSNDSHLRVECRDLSLRAAMHDK